MSYSQNSLFLNLYCSIHHINTGCIYYLPYFLYILFICICTFCLIVLKYLNLFSYFRNTLPLHSFFLKFYIYLFTLCLSLCMCVCACTCMTQCTGGYSIVCGVSPLLPPHGSQGSSWHCCQACWQVSITESSHFSIHCFSFRKIGLPSFLRLKKFNIFLN